MSADKDGIGFVIGKPLLHSRQDFVGGDREGFPKAIVHLSARWRVREERSVQRGLIEVRINRNGERIVRHCSLVCDNDVIRGGVVSNVD